MQAGLRGEQVRRRAALEESQCSERRPRKGSGSSRSPAAQEVVLVQLQLGVNGLAVDVLHLHLPSVDAAHAVGAEVALVAQQALLEALLGLVREFAVACVGLAAVGCEALGWWGCVS